MKMLRKISCIQKKPFKRILGISDLFAIGYGDLGSSIYYALGITALYALGATPISLLLAGVVFVCTALTYAEMSSTFHESGGSASFARHAFNDLISFIAGWGLLLDYIVTIAISSFAIGPYLSFFIPELAHVPIQLTTAVGLICILLIMNILGIRQSTRISWILMVLALVTQGIIIVIGLSSVTDFSLIFDHMKIGIEGVNWSPTWPEFWKGTAMAMVAYTGIESIAQLGAEAKHPVKTIPRAIITTMVVLIVLYFGISVVGLSVMTPKELGTDYLMDPVAGIVKNLPFGVGVLAPWVGLLAAIILFVATNAGLVGASRLAYNLGENYQLPSFFCRLLPKKRTPAGALCVFAFAASLIVLLSFGRLSFLTDLYNFGAMIAFFFAHISLIVLRIKQPDLKRSFLVPFNICFKSFRIPIPAIIGCIATFSVWCLVVITKPEGRILGFSWIFLGVILYLFVRRKQKISSLGSLEIEKITIPGYQENLIRHVLLCVSNDADINMIQMALEFAHLKKAKIAVIYPIEIPPSLPFDAKIKVRELHAQSMLKQVEAVAREVGTSVDLKMFRTRSTLQSLLHMVKGGKIDLIVIDSKEKEVIARFSRKNLCRMWIYG